MVRSRKTLVKQSCFHLLKKAYRTIRDKTSWLAYTNYRIDNLPVLVGIKIAPADEGQEGYKNGAMIFWSLLTPFFGTALGLTLMMALDVALG